MAQLRLVTLDLQALQTLNDLLDAFALAFEYAEGYSGKNPDSCIDILSGLRFPEQGMTRAHLAEDESILLRAIHMGEACNTIRQWLCTIVAAVNSRAEEMEQAPLIYLLLTE